MNANQNIIDEIFGEGAAAKMDAAEHAERERVALWTSRAITEAGVLKAWMMTPGVDGHMCFEMSDLTGSGWDRRNPPERITVAFEQEPFGHLKVYRRWMTDRTPDGDIGAWIYVPNNPEAGVASQIHIFND